MTRPLISSQSDDELSPHSAVIPRTGAKFWCGDHLDWVGMAVFIILVLIVVVTLIVVLNT